MILFTFKYEPQVRAESYPKYPAFRWTFQIGWDHIGFVHQCQNGKTQKWHDSGATRYDAWLTKHFRVGSHHAYYDGANCSFQLGWIQFCWSSDNCKKCFGEA